MDIVDLDPEKHHPVIVVVTRVFLKPVSGLLEVTISGLSSFGKERVRLETVQTDSQKGCGRCEASLRR